MGEPAISFGPYQLFATRRLLLEGDKPVRLGSRAFDILTALTERAGQVISKEELIARAWPETSVEEANLKIQVSALRRAIGDGQGDNRYIATVVGRGYNFVAPIREAGPSPALRSPPTVPAAPHNLPFATTRVIGREEIAATLVTRLSRQRLVAIVGPGGVGKTTVALAVAERMIDAYEHGVWLVDLAPLGDPGLVPSTVAMVLGLQISAENPLPSLLAALADSRMLLVLDNCEHVIDATANLVSALLGGTPGISILATSREPLGVPGEHVHRLGPLSSPEPSAELTATAAVAFPAVRLFVERVSAIVEDFVLTDANAPLVGAICRRLDGLPLAIEFAAPRIEVLGVEGLAARLDDSFRRLSGTRRRAAIPRHQTMRAVIDWSYGLLRDDEQRLFRALGIFAGGFTREAVAAVAMDTATGVADAIDRLADLVAKSLVVADVSGTTPRFRLLDTTRAYALEKLTESGEATRTARRHAEFYLGLFAAVRSKGVIENLRRHLREVDNLRAALNWAFFPGGDAVLGTELAAESIDFWGAASLLRECCEWAEKALAEIGAAAGTRREMVLRCGLGTALIYSRGQSSLARAALTMGLALARKFEDFDYQQRAAFGLWQFVGRTESLKDALIIARHYEEIAGHRDVQSRATADWLIGLSLCYLPGLVEAGERLQRAVDLYPVDRRARDMIRLGADPRASALCHLALNLLLRGHLDAASETAIRAIEDARATKHPVALCLSLLWAGCVVSLNLGELDTVEQYRDELLDVAQKHGLRPFHAAGLCTSGSLLARRGEPREGVSPLRAGLAELLETRYLMPSPFFQAKLAATLAATGSVAEGVIEIDDALRRTTEMDNRWIVPELLRVKGEMLLRRGADDPAVIADMFGQSLKQAREQQALYWELCTATSLARLLCDQGRPADAHACLQPVYDRFSEGFGTADLIAAKQLLDDRCASGHR